MRVSLNLTDFSWATTPREIVARLTEVAQAVDEAGLDTLWVGDHLLQADPTAAPDGPMLEAYTTLGHLAAITARVRLGTMVTAVSYRPAAPADQGGHQPWMCCRAAGRGWASAPATTPTRPA